jgi:GntR family transcriptional regulator
MILKLNPQAGQALYIELMQQIRHAIETGVLHTGERLPGIRTLATELLISHKTVARAYAELEHEGLLDLRHRSGAYVLPGHPAKSRTERMRLGQERVRALVEKLRRAGFTDKEIRSLFEAQLLYPAQIERET